LVASLGQVQATTPGCSRAICPLKVTLVTLQGAPPHSQIGREPVHIEDSRLVNHF